jgi:hypothetical protein
MSDPLAPLEVTWDMIVAGVAAYDEYDSESEDPETLVFQIIRRAFDIANRNKALASKTFLFE